MTLASPEDYDVRLCGGEKWLSLGGDVLKLDGTRHDAELAEARGLAAARWNQLIDMESQAEREEAALATRPKKRPTQPTDDQLPDRTIEKRARAWEEQTKYLHAQLADLRKLAAAERKELQSLRCEVEEVSLGGCHGVDQGDAATNGPRAD